jgi:hypothetical protein
MKIKEVVREIETTYDVRSIEHKKIPVWLDVRNRIFFKLSLGVESNLTISRGTYFHILSSFFYGFFNWFKKYDCWFIGAISNRVLIEGKYYDRLFDYPATRMGKSLFIELSISKHYKRKNEKMYGLFILSSTKNVAILEEINKTYKLEINHKYAIKKILSQYKVMKFILIFKSPKFVFISPSYTSYGYIKAFKEKKIKVIEVQHGVINREHFGYNLYTEFNKEYSPDFLLTFGENEKCIFGGDNFFIDPNNVIPIGSFYIDHINNSFIPNEALTTKCKEYQIVISVSLQDCPTGAKLPEFIMQAARENLSHLYLVKTRRTPIESYEEQYDIPDNVLFVTDLNVYETILYSDYHLTAFSSCALEAPALGKKNILFNIDNKAQEYYGSILNNNNTTVYANDFDEYIQILRTIRKEEEEFIKSEHQSVLIANYTENMDSFINRIK